MWLPHLFFLLAQLTLIVVLLSSCATEANVPASPYFMHSPLYVAPLSSAKIEEYKTMAVLPSRVIVNTRYPGTDLAAKRSERAAEHQELWMIFHYNHLQAHADELNVNIQSPDTTLALLRHAGIALDSLRYFSRQRLLEVLQVDALLMHDIEINIYSTPSQNVAANAGALLLFAAGATRGVVPKGNPQAYSGAGSIEFYKLYGKGIETPIWSFYDTSGYDGKEPPELPQNTSLGFYQHTNFPLLKKSVPESKGRRK